MAVRTYRTAADRWAGVGPYYAMFPVDFANRVVQRYTRRGDGVLDPFAGRGTAVFSAAAADRRAVGVEVAPVGYVYGRTKLSPAPRDSVLDRLHELRTRAPAYDDAAEDLPEFFHWCFAPLVREFLLAARAELDWRRKKVDRTTMALLLVYLHGKKGAALSNQMRQTKAMSPQYAIRWWRKRRSRPPDLDPADFMKSRLAWRYAKGVPAATQGRMYLGDSRAVLRRLHQQQELGRSERFSLLFTSPPYHRVTNYHYDQWLRGWLLGGRSDALRRGASRRAKFEHTEMYRSLLADVFGRARDLLTEDAVVYVRTDSRKFTLNTTEEVLREVFPKKSLRKYGRPVVGRTQTGLFGNGGQSSGEVDIVLHPSRR